MIKNYFYQNSVNDLYQKFESSNSGLTTNKIKEKLEKFGFNEIPENKKLNIFQKIIIALTDPMAIILIVASIFSLAIQDFIEAIVILLVVVINTVISLIQDQKAEKAVEELKKMLSPYALVLRNGELEQIAAKFIVPGDIIVFEAGDIIPSDARVLEAQNLLVDEAHLTGETEPITKNTLPIEKNELRLYEMQNIVFSGSKILNGTGKAIVLNTGLNTEMGQIAIKMGSIKEETTPLQKKLKIEIKFLLILAFVSAFLVVTVNLIRTPVLNQVALVNIILTAISIMVAVFPEGLPAAITISLSLATERLAKNSILIKKLSSIETLGNVDFICTDKTGTITQHRMTVKEYQIGNTFYNTSDIFKKISEGEDKIFHDLFLTGLKTSTAQVMETDGVIEKEMGDPTEIALLKSSILSGYKLNQFKDYVVTDNVPFSSELMYSACTLQTPNSKENILVLKGAPERVLNFCDRYYVNQKYLPLNKEKKQEISHLLTSRSEQGYRLISFAKKELTENNNDAITKIENTIYLGTAIIYDPPKDEVKLTIKEAKEAGIKVVMITGDSKKTGFSIAEHVGIAERIDQAIEGKELEALSSHEFHEKVENFLVYSRVAPLDKLKIVEQLKAKNHIVAMTGDGVNDALALKKSDVGIAMGRAGSQVAQEAADIILTDDNFGTIINGIKEGRTIYQNLKKLVRYLVTNNVGKVLALLVTPLLGFPTPLLAVQILWSNVIMEALPAVAISVDPSNKSIMKKAPIKLNDPIFFLKERGTLIFDGILFGLAITFGYIFIMNQTHNPDLARTTAFMITLISPQLYIFVLREGNLWQKVMNPNKLLKSCLLITILSSLLLVYVPVLNQIFKTAPIFNYKIWVLILMLSVLTSITRLLIDGILSFKRR